MLAFVPLKKLLLFPSTTSPENNTACPSIKPWSSNKNKELVSAPTLDTDNTLGVRNVAESTPAPVILITLVKAGSNASWKLVPVRLAT